VYTQNSVVMMVTFAQTIFALIPLDVHIDQKIAEMATHALKIGVILPPPLPPADASTFVPMLAVVLGTTLITGLAKYVLLELPIQTYIIFPGVQSAETGPIALVAKFLVRPAQLVHTAETFTLAILLVACLALLVPLLPLDLVVALIVLLVATAAQEDYASNALAVPMGPGQASDFAPDVHQAHMLM